MSRLDLYNELLRMRTKYHKHPLDFIDLKRPRWLDSEDPMFQLLKKKKLLLQQGEIIYAHIVQANVLLFSRRGHEDHPANLVYSFDPLCLEDPYNLAQVASKIYKLKRQDLNSIPDEWKDVAKTVKSEIDRTEYIIPLEMNGQSFEVKMIASLIFRKLLPGRKLCGGLLPVLSVPDCNQVLILPRRYWTFKFKIAWLFGRI